MRRVVAALAVVVAAVVPVTAAGAQDLPDPTHDAEDVRRAAREILDDPRYEPPPRSLAERVTDWIGERLADLFGALGGSGGPAGALFAWALVLGASAVVALVLARSGGFSVPGRTTVTAAETMVEVSRRPDEWRAEAARLEAAGRWAEGLRCRYRALVGELVLRGVIPELPGRTAGEYVRDVARALPEGAPTFSAATELFEAVWYGGAETGAAEAARFAELDERTLGARVAR